MLRTRILTALVLLPLALAGIFLLSAQQFTIAIALILMVGSWEFHRLAGLKALPGGALLVTLESGIMAVLIGTWAEWTANPIPPFFLACTAWLIMFLQLRFHDVNAAPGRGYRARGFVNAIAAISFGWMALAWLRSEPAGEWWILLLLLTIWAADVFAYFTGRALGKTKLAPKISPGKTRAGLYGGIIGAALVTGLGALLIPSIDADPLWLALLGAVTALVSVGGDLFISLHKRTVGLKDTGRVFPGHGGILDRLDSLLAGAPFFVLGKLLLGL